MKWFVARLGLAALGRLPLGGRRLRALRRRMELAKLYREDLALWRVEKARDLGVKVGKGCRFFSLNFQSEPYLIEIGDDVIISGEVILVTHDGAVFLLRKEIPNINGHYGRIKIGDNCFVGMGAIILPNVELGDNCIVAAGAVVFDSFPAGSVIMGNPARVVFNIDTYRKLKEHSPYTIVDERYPFPMGYPPEMLIERLGKLPIRRPRKGEA
ncbi:MAG: acyltransferase [Candidatus Polarisedimenticolia bacterium]|nr:acyltransferase [bacterium]